MCIDIVHVFKTNIWKPLRESKAFSPEHSCIASLHEHKWKINLHLSQDHPSISLGLAPLRKEG